LPKQLKYESGAKYPVAGNIFNIERKVSFFSSSPHPRCSLRGKGKATWRWAFPMLPSAGLKRGFKGHRSFKGHWVFKGHRAFKGHWPFKDHRTFKCHRSFKGHWAFGAIGLLKATGAFRAIGTFRAHQGHRGLTRGL